MNILRQKVSIKVEDEYDNKLSVLTYNLLADCHVVLCRDISYPYVVDDDLLKQDGMNSKRHVLAMKEIKYFDACVLLLQEVGEDYSSILSSELENSGYAYTFLQKQGVSEGCAICFKHSKFECMDTIDFVVHDEIKRIGNENGIAHDIIDEIAKPTVALIKVLKDRETDKIVVCATTHTIYEGFSDPALQALQACLICQKIFEIRQKLASKLQVNVESISVIFGGDFNAEPQHSCIQLMKNGKLSPSQMKTLQFETFELICRKAVPSIRTNANNVCNYFSDSLMNPLNLRSAYRQVKGIEPLVTSADGTYEGVLDYIFHTSDLKVSSVFDIDLSTYNIYVNGGPTKKFASDHLPLIAEFVY